MRRFIMACFACILLAAVLAATGLHQTADASLPDGGGVASSACDTALAGGVEPAPASGSDSDSGDQLPTYAQTLPQNGCTQCKDGKKICCKSGECRTVKC
jgi:hypothetical protein